MTDKTKHEASADGDAALLAQFGFSDLPVMFAMRDGNGAVIQEKEPCYQCMADGFYGRGRVATYYEETSIIVTDAVPNQHLQPLNRAAALRWAKWAAALPHNRIVLDMGDISEAMTMLAARPDFMTMTPEQRSEAAMKFAESLKLRREGKDAKSIPMMSHNFAPQSGRSNAAPLLGAKVSDMAQRGPGGDMRTLSQSEVSAGGARRAAAAPATANPLGGDPAR